MGIEDYLDECFDWYFRDLVRERKMPEPRKQVSGMGGLYETSIQNLIVRLVNDRGIVGFELASVHRPTDFRDLELVSELFRKSEDTGPGVARLSLQEQANLLRERWDELNEMLDVESYERTNDRLAELGRRRAKLMFGRD